MCIKKDCREGLPPISHRQDGITHTDDREHHGDDEDARVGIAAGSTRGCGEGPPFNAAGAKDIQGDRDCNAKDGDFQYAVIQALQEAPLMRVDVAAHGGWWLGYI